MLKHRPTYGEFQQYLIAMRYHLFLTALLFAVSTMAGYGYSAFNPEFSAGLTSELSSRFGTLVELPPPLLMLRIFAQSSVLSFFAMILGVVFAIIPVVFIIYNGFVIGAVIYTVSRERGIMLILLNILPHGVIEVPMILLSVAIGIRLGQETVKRLLNRGNIKKTLIEGLKMYAFWVLPLLLIAAAIETMLII